MATASTTRIEYNNTNRTTGSLSSSSRNRRARILYYYGNISGMATDIQVFRHVLEQNGWTVELGYFDDDPIQYDTVDLQISLEQIYGTFLPLGRVNAFMPNQEIMHDTAKYALVDLILCKTRYAKMLIEQRCRQLNIQPPATPRIVHIRFSSKDIMAALRRYDPVSQGAWCRPELESSSSKISQQQPHPAFLHVAGKSRCKQTRAVMDAWAQHPDWPPLHVVCNPAFIGKDIRPYLATYDDTKQNKSNPDSTGVPLEHWPNIIMYTQRLSERTLRKLQMSIPFHICPSETEGWGHAINESRSCAAIVITTDGPPMNELVRHHMNGILVKPYKKIRFRRRHIWMSILNGEVSLVRPLDVVAAIEQCLSLTIEQRQKLALAARKTFEEDRRYFDSTMANLLHTYFPYNHDDNDMLNIIEPMNVKGQSALQRHHQFNIMRSRNYLRANVRQLVDIFPKNILRSLMVVVMWFVLLAVIRRQRVSKRQ